MTTYQDLMKVGTTEQERSTFVYQVISDHKGSELYQKAVIADAYDKGQNTTIMSYQKMLTTIKGTQTPDTQSTMHRSASNFFGMAMTQLCQYLLGNGVTWNENKDKDKKLGKDFDTRLQEAGKAALVNGVSFGFFNLDHMQVFKVTEFAPLYDEENGALMAGVRFWRIDDTKPLRASLYEIDGVTQYIWIDKDKLKPDAKWQFIAEGVYYIPKQPYKINKQSADDGTEIYNYDNYPSLPIVPLWGNPHHQSELTNLREKIDAYDFILNGFEDDLDNAQLYWIIKGAGGMDDIDLSLFLDRLRNVKAAAPADGQEVEPVTINIPYEARERLLDRLEKQLYKDAMIMNPDDIASGAATATQIRAAYERQNVKADQFEYCVLDFISGILAVAGIDDEPTFTRSTIVNTQEEVQTVVMAASYLGSEYVTRKILTILGDGDQAEDVLRQVAGENLERFGSTYAPTEKQEQEAAPEEAQEAPEE